MKREVVDCDSRSCNTKKPAKRFYFFKETKTDGGGSREDWDYTFDLCPDCQQYLFQELLTKIGEGLNINKAFLINMLKNVNLRDE